MSDSLKKQVLDILKDNLYLEVDETTKSVYTGGMDGGDLYRDQKTIKLRLVADIDDEKHFIDSVEFEV